MTHQDNDHKKPSLRQKAERLLNLKSGKSGLQRSESEMLKLLHELEVHQIELKLQNEELMRSKSEIEEITNKYIELYDFAPCGYFTLSTEGKIIEVNLSGARLLGRERSLIKTRDFSFFVASHMKKDFKKFLETVFKSGEVKSRELTLSLPDGKEVPIHMESVKVNHEKQCFLTVVDISELKEARKNVADEKIIAQQYLEIANVILLSLDPSGNVIMINPKGCEVLGYTEQEVIGKNWYDEFIPSGIRDKVKKNAEKILSGEGETHKYFENEVLTASGEKRLIAWNNSILKDKNGRIISTLSSGDDITEKKSRERELRKYRENLEELVKARTMELETATSELQEKVSELESFFNATVDREIKMEGLRSENKELVKKLKDTQG